eukprot:gene465-477_t
MGDRKILDSDYANVEKEIKKITQEDQPFQRLELTKEEALEMFKDNPFKVQLITNKVPEGSLTSCYKCGPLIDLCRGPHIPSTGKVKAAAVMKHSSAYWLGKAELDSLQRIYAITFPDDKQMKANKKAVEAAAKNDNRKIGLQQELFFFHPTLAPGNAFWEERGLRVSMKLQDFIRKEWVASCHMPPPSQHQPKASRRQNELHGLIFDNSQRCFFPFRIDLRAAGSYRSAWPATERLWKLFKGLEQEVMAGCNFWPSRAEVVFPCRRFAEQSIISTHCDAVSRSPGSWHYLVVPVCWDCQYRIRGFNEVKHPLMFNAELFKISGHYMHYKDDMYNVNIEGEDWFLKPMNCPGHCI